MLNAPSIIGDSVRSVRKETDGNVRNASRGGESSARGDRSNLGTDGAVHKNKMRNDKEWKVEM